MSYFAREDVQRKMLRLGLRFAAADPVRQVVTVEVINEESLDSLAAFCKQETAESLA